MAVRWKAWSRAIPVSPRKARRPRLAASSWRACSESARLATRGAFATLFATRDSEPITAATDRLDRLQFAFRIELLAQAADEDLQHIGITIEILLVNVLGQVGLGHQLAGMQHQVLEHLVFVAGQIHAGAIDADRLRGVA